MITGDPLIFAIESAITQAYARVSLRALGFFVIHLAAQRYGVYRPDATMLACSFDGVEQRLARRGMHTTSFAAEAEAEKIAQAVYQSLWGAEQEQEQCFGMSEPEFHELVYSSHLEWAPDGDKAFDDGSHVLHFDVEDRVRLIAFKVNEQGDGFIPNSLCEVWLPADHFYHVLRQWRDAFQAEWAALPKTLERDEQV
jgi:hypothetical protein